MKDPTVVVLIVLYVLLLCCILHILVLERRLNKALKKRRLAFVESVITTYADAIATYQVALDLLRQSHLPIDEEALSFKVDHAEDYEWMFRDLCLPGDDLRGDRL